MKRDKYPSFQKSKILGYLQDYRFNSILVKSFLTILIFLIITVTIIMIAVTGKMNDIITEEVGNMSINSLGKTRDRIDVVMAEVAQVSGHLSLDEDVQRFMLPNTNVLFGTTHTMNVKKKIEMYSGVFDYIDSIYVYSHKNKYIVSDEDGSKIENFGDISWLSNLTEREYEPARMISRTKNSGYPNLISYIQPIRLTQMQFLGGIIVNMNNDKLEDMVVSNIQDARENLIIVDNRNNIIYSSNAALLRKKIGDIAFYNQIDYERSDGYQIIDDGEQDVIIAVASSNEFQWKYISSIPLSAYADHKDSISVFQIGLYVVSMLLSILVAFVISIYSYNPVKNILDLLKNPDLYQDSISEDTGFRKNETHEIALNIIRNLYSNRQMQGEMKTYADIIDKAQLTALQAQISPHFLYNTLENIRWRATSLGKGDNEVSQSIVYLSEMLRNSLDIDQQLITLEEEIHNTKLYVKILQLRYEDKLKVVWDVDKELLSYTIVKVSLQPLIENAVYHGIKPLRTQGNVNIRIYRKDERLIIEVTDNGVGMTPETVAKLNEDMHDKYKLGEEHIGIRNVNQRLKLLLGDDAEIKISSKAGEKTKITLLLPLQKYVKEQAEDE